MHKYKLRYKAIILLLAITIIITVCSNKVNSKNSQVADSQNMTTTIQDNSSVDYKYINIPPLKVSYDNTLLKSIVDNKWDKGLTDKLLGKPDSYFNRYDIYFDRGINVSHSEIPGYRGDINISGRVFNIILNDKYNKDIIDGINMSSTKSKIVNQLGTPQFENREEKVFGYKTEDFYIFFLGDEKLEETSIYRRDTKEDFIENIINVINKKYKDIDSEVKLVGSVIDDPDINWSGYDYYFNSGYKYGIRANHIGIGYLSSGIKLEYYYGSESDKIQPFITIGGNFEGYLASDLSLPSQIEGLKDFHSDIIKLELDKDYIFDYEIQRLKDKKTLAERIKKEGVISPDKSMVVLTNDDNNINPSLSGAYIIHLDKSKPDIDFRAVFYIDAGHYNWLSNRYIAYDVFKRGVFVYDIKENKSTCIIDKFEARLISAGDGVIKYTWSSNDGDIISTLSYSFDNNGNIHFKNPK